MSDISRENRFIYLDWGNFSFAPPDQSAQAKGVAISQVLLQ
jgi:hypothetical protein